MDIPNNNHSQKHSKGIIFSPLKLSGPSQMAIDLLLLEKSILLKNFSMAIRFYTWDGDWLSIGRNQAELPQKWIDLAKKGGINLVKRPSGGNAVLHSGGLTYSIIWTEPPLSRRKAYLKTSEWLIEGLSQIGINLKFGKESAKNLPPNCFATSTTADLIDENGEKRLGSAQFWKKGHLLQHGELILNPPSDLWEYLFEAKSPSSLNNQLDQNQIINILTNSIKNYWSKIEWDEQTLSKDELNEISKKSKIFFLNLS